MIDFKSILKKSIPYVTGVVIFLIVSALYFKPAFNGYDVKQADMVNYRGMSNDLNAFYEQNPGQEPLWTNSMFSGMPATQIALFEHGNNVRTLREVISLGLPHPVNILFLYFIGFFFLALILRINPWIAIVGALAFGFSSYFIIIIEAGHVTKAYTIAFMAPVVGAFIMAYRRNLLWGIILSAFFMMLEIGSNHVQITYYLGFVLLALGVLELYRAIKTKTYKQFALATVGVLFAYLLAGLSSAANLLPTMEYAEETIRGKNNLTITSDLRPNDENSTDGLNRDYVTQWSYGKSESLTLFIPYAKGGHSVPVSYGEFADKLKESDFTRVEKEYIGNSSQYWGDQPFTSGPVYVGALVFLLAILGLFFIKSAIKWPLLIVTILALFLSWGKNMMWFTDLFLDYLPMYSKFRAVTIILVVIELCIPLLAILFLNQLYQNREEIAKQKQKFYIVSGGAVLVMLVLIASPSITGLYSTSEKDKLSDPDLYIRKEVTQQINQLSPDQLMQYGVSNPKDPMEMKQFTDAVVNQQIESYEASMPAVKEFRSSIFSSDAVRSLIFMILGLALLAIFIFSTVHPSVLIGGLGILIIADLIPLNLKYLNYEGEERSGQMIYDQWLKSEEKLYPFVPKDTDLQILEAEMAQNTAMANVIGEVSREAEMFAREKDYTRIAKNNYINREKFRVYNENTHFRVADLTDPVSQSSRASYFHESIGGYHGAKLQRYQNLFEFDFIPYDQQVLNMLNTKYVVQNTAQGPMVRTNAGAMGNAWLTKEVVYAEDEDEEILKLGKEYTVESQSDWKLLVNDNATKKSKVYGREDVIAVKGIDSIVVQWPDGLSVSTSAFLVSDINGNINWVPSMVLENDTTNSFSPVVKLTVDYNFAPAKMTLTNAENKNYIGNISFSGNGKIELQERTLKYHKFSFESDEEQLAVFSEIYYPVGWTAKIDGKEVEHIRVNYVLRGLKIPAGKHTIEFEVNESTYQKGLTYAKIGSWVILLLLIGGLGYEAYRAKKKRT